MVRVPLPDETSEPTVVGPTIRTASRPEPLGSGRFRRLSPRQTNEPPTIRTAAAARATRYGPIPLGQRIPYDASESARYPHTPRGAEAARTDPTAPQSIPSEPPRTDTNRYRTRTGTERGWSSCTNPATVSLCALRRTPATAPRRTPTDQEQPQENLDFASRSSCVEPKTVLDSQPLRSWSMETQQ